MRIPTLPLSTALSLATLLCLVLWGIGATTPRAPERYRGKERLTFSVEELHKAAKYAPYLPDLRYIQVVIRQRDRKLPEAIQSFQQVRQLEILGNGGYCSLKALATLSNLRVLRIDHVVGEHNINYWGRLNQLKELHILNCHLENLPSNFNEWKNLEVLDLSNNKFTLKYYVEELMQLPRLKALRMDQNPIQRLPIRLFQHTTLQYLSLQYCDIKDTIGTSYQNNSLRELYLNNNALTTFPANILDLSKLEQLDLSNNGLEELPELDTLAMTLKQVDLKSNRLKTIPVSWLRYPWLSHLSVKRNRIHTLPEMSDHTVSLRYLNLRYNLLETVPPVLMRMTALKYLDLQHNLIRTVPSFVDSHPSLSDIIMGVGGFFGSSNDFKEEERAWSLLQPYSVLEDSPMHRSFRVN